MITRIVEYVINCDNEDCNYMRGTMAYGWHSRQVAESEAERLGWARCTYKRWLCPDCKKRAEEADERPLTRADGG